ncbi:MAG TPA: HD domain-containing phosphohydrolase, partial [Geminicoccaceae bacterium]|nr:HD domain-containing phosphohydrolase [Geminicoccaceae bacterium]
MASARDDPFGGLDLEQQAPRPRPGPFIASSLIALLLVAALAGGLVKVLVDDRTANLHAAQGARMEAMARGRAEIIATWLNGIAQTGRRLTEADLLRLFANELALHEPSEPLRRPLVEELPQLQEMIDDFARQNGLVGAGLVDLEGRWLLMSSGAPQLHYDPLPLLDDVSDRWISPIRTGDLDDTVLLGARLLMDVALPVPVEQPWLAGERPEVAAVLFMVVPVAEQLAGLLDAKPLLGLGERVRLIQWSERGSEQVIAGPDPRIVPIDLGEALVPGRFRAYGPLDRADGSRTFAVGAAVPGVPWTVLHEIEANAALAPLREFATIALIVAGLAGLALVLAFAAFWWRRSNAHQRELARQYRELAAGIQRQRRLLESITDAMQEMLCLKTPDGRYVYVNPAFADAVGKPIEDVVGRTDVELFGSEFAAAEAASDRRALDGAPLAAETRQLELCGRTRHLSTSKVRVCDDAGRTTGLVAVSRDESELIEQRRRHERLLRATVDALIRAVELRDPFLVGHTRRVQRYAAMVGRRLGLDEGELATLDIAASLSQVGKIFVPQDILTNPGRLEEEQIRVMHRHVEHALRVIGPIEFDLPIAETIGQMYERLDGSGYPRGLRGAQIRPLARILGVVDVFCALTETRAYRDQQSSGRALLHLAEHPQRYDVKVV